MSERKLASVRRISEIRPIPEADNIQTIVVDGWQLVTQKSNGFKVGDLICYYEIDAFLPVRPEYEFLRPKCYKNTENLGEGFRIKTIKLKGQVSQGLALPLKDVLEYDFLEEEVVEGQDLTEYLGVKKYEAPIPAQLAGKVRGNFPGFLRKTDSERAQNCLKEIHQHMDEPFEITVKLDGSSMTAYLRSNNTLMEPEVGVCSRNMNLIADLQNSFWQVARNKRIIDALEALFKASGAQLAFQGELVGPGVQKNKEKLPELDFYLFNIYDIERQVYLSPREREVVVNGLKDIYGITINHVPIIAQSQKLDVALQYPHREEVMERLVELSKGTMMDGRGCREGIVFKHSNSDFNFKVINPDFLLKYDE